MTTDIFPKALVAAARTFAKKPAIVGEVLVALCVADGAATTKLTEVQQYILAECRAEIEERKARRETAAAKKRQQRTRKEAK